MSGERGASVASRTAVTLTSFPLWRLRLRSRATRWIINAAAIAGLLASARFALDPPHGRNIVNGSEIGFSAELRGQAFATQFARAYLTWDAQAPEEHRSALAPFGGSALNPEAGMQPPSTGSEHVLWTQVAQERTLSPRRHIYTVAVDTDSGGLVYLTVPVAGGAHEPLALAGYPAFVGPPATSEARAGTWGVSEVEEPALATVVTRAMRNYLEPAPAELAADLALGARVSPPDVHLSLESVQSLSWAQGTGAVVAVVTASGADGARYTLAYELDVLSAGGRWEISAIQMDPDA